MGTDNRDEQSRTLPAGAFPLSAVQRSMWFAQQLHPAVPYFIAQYIEIHGDLDIDLLSRSAVAAAHEFESPFLRLMYPDGEPCQIVDPTIGAEIDYFDFRECDDPREAAAEWMDNDHATPLDLTRDRLVEMTILQTGDRDYLWYTRIHHVALDGYSGMTIVNRIAALYTSELEGREPAPNKALDVVKLSELDQAYRASSRFDADRQYWAERIAGVDHGSTLAGREAPPRAHSRIVTDSLSETSVAALDEWSARSGATPAAVLISALACYLSRRTGYRDVLINLPVSARTTAPLQRSGGMLVNVAPLHIEVLPGDTVDDLVGRVQLELLGALRHQRCSLEDIRRDAGLSMEDQRLSGPMMNVMLFRQEITLGPMVGEYHIVTSGPVEDLLVNIYQSGSPVKTLIEFRANPDRYERTELEEHHADFAELIRELIAVGPGTPLDHVHRRTAEIGGERARARELEQFWAREMTDAPEGASVVLDRPRTSDHREEIGTLRTPIAPELHQRMRAAGTDVFSLVHGALAIVLSRLTNTDDIVIGARFAPGAPVVPLRSAVDQAHSCADVLNDVADHDVTVRDYSQGVVDTAGLHVVLTDGPTNRTIEGADLSIGVVDDAGTLTLDAAYDQDVLDERSAQQVLTRVLRALGRALESPGMAVGDLPILDEAEGESLRAVPGPAAASPRTLAHILCTAAQVNPDADAVVVGDQALTYRDLDAQSNALARELIARGVGPGTYVALALARSRESVIATWAVAKAGGAFLPVDPHYPSDRITHMLTDSGATLGICTSDVRGGLGDTVDWLVLGDLEEHRSSAAITDADLLRPLRLDDPAYLIYTSGSTGVPKGVVVTHRGVSSFAEELRIRFGTTPDARTLHFSSPSFDASVLELLLAFGAAATMVIAPPTVYGGEELAEVLRAGKVTHAFITPAALATVDPDHLPLLRVIATGGDACSSSLVEQWSGHRLMFNAYGPTETTVVATMAGPLRSDVPVTIGQPVRGASAMVLDARLHPVPIGVAGELYVSGVGLARGYHGQGATTAQRFVAAPNGEAGERMYRTGDLVRWTADGELEDLGHSDFQIKVRGFRIELGEIDEVLRQHSSLDDVVTVGVSGSSGQTMLASYVTAAPGMRIEVPEVTAHAAASLAPHMVPSRIVVLDAIPLTPAGKIDRNALPAIDEASGIGEYRAPESSTEKRVSAVYCDLLGIARAGTNDSFFDLGGDSLIATRVVARVNGALGTSLSVLDLFEAPTVSGLAARADSSDSRETLLPPLTRIERPEPIPASLAQQRMWLINQLDPASPAYNIPIAVHLTGPLNVAALSTALRDVLIRHESLRTVFPATAWGPVQQVLDV